MWSLDRVIANILKRESCMITLLLGSQMQWPSLLLLLLSLLLLLLGLVIPAVARRRMLKRVATCRGSGRHWRGCLLGDRGVVGGSWEEEKREGRRAGGIRRALMMRLLGMMMAVRRLSSCHRFILIKVILRDKEVRWQLPIYILSQ